MFHSFTENQLNLGKANFKSRKPDRTEQEKDFCTWDQEGHNFSFSLVFSLKT